MAKKIAKIDNDAMNSLYAGEFGKLAGQSKTATTDWQDDKGAPKDPQAFADHSEYLATLKSVLAEDGKDDFDPNDEKLD